MEDDQPGCAATEVVEPSTFVAAGDRLLVHLNSSYNTACRGDTRAATKSFEVLVEEPQQVERETHTTSQKKKKL